MNTRFCLSKLILTALIFFPKCINAQENIPQKSYEVSGQTKFDKNELISGNVNSSGKVNISFPIYSIETQNFKLPITINYSTGGIKVAESPSIVGLGWGLNSGGMVTRIVKGSPDEEIRVIEDYSPDLNAIFSYGTSNDVSYIGNYSKLNRNDWNQMSYMNTIASSNGYAFSSNVYGLYPLNMNIDLAPDEFMFNVNNLSGSFFLDHTGNWVVNANQEVKVEVAYENAVAPYTGVYVLPRTIVAITLTDEGGNKYIFGKYNGYYAIEYSRTPMSYTPFGYTDMRGNTNAITSVSWFLQKIILVSGEEVSYKYKNSDQLNTRRNPNLFLYAPSTAPTTTLKYIEKSLIQTHIIEKISTTFGVTVDFITTNSVQLDNDIPINETYASNEYSFNQV